MTDLLNAILLGIIQGLTEFLPVSSSGHLVLAQSMLPGFDAPPAAFDALLHGGTMMAVVAYFYRDIVEICSGLKKPGDGGLRLPLLLVAGSIPIGVLGVFYLEAVESMFSSPKIASMGLLITAGLLAVALYFGKGNRRLSEMLLWNAFLVGCFQALALVPGISRSGATISIALVMGFAGTEAAKFSFLLSLPAIAGAIILEAGALLNAENLGIYMVGALAAAISGWVSIAILMRFLQRRRLLPFILYCLALGSLSLAFLV
ncbi:undecaprenyl-diphosphate phosphatase [bacterium]|nr:MAG: undecaprenyl-diphosphate phosphatase [bacterium]